MLRIRNVCTTTAADTTKSTAMFAASGRCGTATSIHTLATAIAAGFTTPSMDNLPLPLISCGRLEKKTWKFGEKKESKNATRIPMPPTIAQKRNCAAAVPGPALSRPKATAATLRTANTAHKIPGKKSMERVDPILLSTKPETPS